LKIHVLDEKGLRYIKDAASHNNKILLRVNNALINSDFEKNI